MARDESWVQCEGTWDRLKWARLQKFSTAKDAAAAFGMKEGTYRQYEREPGSSRTAAYDLQDAAMFGKRLGVRWEWLLLGQGTPWHDPDPNREKILLAYDSASEERRKAVAALMLAAELFDRPHTRTVLTESQIEAGRGLLEVLQRTGEAKR